MYLCKFIIILVKLAFNVHGDDRLESYIVGGEPVDITRFPYTVMFFNSYVMCAGSILNKHVVMTAAHCFDINTDITDMRIQAGSRFVLDKNATSHEVIDFIIHQNYNKSRIFSSDIALLLVLEPFQYNKRIAKAKLVNNDNWMNAKEHNFLAAGWGWTQYGGPISKVGLVYTHLKFIPLEQCNEWHQLKFTEDMFCLYGDGVRDSCRGDSGGGVEWNGMIVGIISHGDGCANYHLPSIYSNVWYFRKWVFDTAAELEKRFCAALTL